MPDDKGAKSERLPLLPLRGLLAYPNMMLKIDVGRDKSIAAVEHALQSDARVVVVAQRDAAVDDPSAQDVYSVGTVVVIRQAIRLPDDTVRLLVEGESRVQLVHILEQDNMQMGELRRISARPERHDIEILALIRTIKDLFSQYARARGDLSSELVQAVIGEDDPEKLSDLVAANALSLIKDKQALLELNAPRKRLEILAGLLSREVQLVALDRQIHERVHQQLDQRQREYYLNEQLSVIHEELGDDGRSENENFARLLAQSAMNDEARAQTERELKRYRAMPSGTPEATVSRSYIECMLELPWGKATKDLMDVPRARRVLDQDHYGLEDVKERVLEFIAVGAIKGSLRGPILCLVGPPGVGKTSVAKSVARALGRKFVRMSLGGLRDEAEIRGHRRTYIGAIPGRIISSIRKCGSVNPVFLLDEIDKMASDSRGDPASALLEALDPEQNATFADHYLEAPFDLSGVLFLTTANQAEAIPAPLLDRMELISLDGYTHYEKAEIARRHLWPKQFRAHGLDKGRVRLNRSALDDIIEGYTRESGVRQLEQRLAKLCRRACMKLASGEAGPLRVVPSNLSDFLGPRKYLPEETRRAPELGVVNALAWTAYGGDTLTIEAVVMPGKGRIELTGQLGDVMKESAQAAHTFVRERAHSLGVEEDFFENHDLHVHVPEGATPKDGPSAGVALACAMASAVTGRSARQDIAMTGEITLSGRVLPVGGIKEKLLAAHRAGILQVMLPRANERDLNKLPEEVRLKLRVTMLDRADQALDAILCAGGEA